MDYKIGELFISNGKIFRVIEGNCDKCYFKYKEGFDEFFFENIGCTRGIYYNISQCVGILRNDRKNVCFKLVE